jgi:hypothetical protein
MRRLGMCRKFLIMMWETLLGGALGGESVELLGWCESLFASLCQLVFP